SWASGRIPTCRSRADRSALLHLEDHLDLDGDAAGQLGHPHRRARVATLLAEDLDHEIGEAVDDLGLLAEALGRVDHAQHLDDALDLVEAAQHGARRAEEIDAHLARDLVAILRGEIAPDLAARRRLALDAAGAVPGEEEQVAHTDARDVVAAGLGRIGEGEAELLDAAFSTHGDSSLTAEVRVRSPDSLIALPLRQGMVRRATRLRATPRRRRRTTVASFLFHCGR